MDLLKPHSKFFGRQGMVRNLLHGIRSGKSFLISGGPSIGKTALIHHLIDLLEQEISLGKHPSNLPVYFSFRNLKVKNVNEIADHLYYRLDTIYPKGLGLDRFILFLDDCEAFSVPGGAEALEHLLSPPGASLMGVPWSVLWSGDENWIQDYFRRFSKFPKSLGLVPLSIFNEKESREILKEVLGPSRAQDLEHNILDQTGRHPYLIFTLLSFLVTDPHLTLERGFEKCRPIWEMWAQRCWEAVNLDSEKKEYYRRILEFLIDRKTPVNPSEVGQALSLHEIKPYLDTLCRLGLSDRTLREGEATILAGCAFFNDWYKRIVNNKKEC